MLSHVIMHAARPNLGRGAEGVLRSGMCRTNQGLWLIRKMVIAIVVSSSRSRDTRSGTAHQVYTSRCMGRGQGTHWQCTPQFTICTLAAHPAPDRGQGWPLTTGKANALWLVLLSMLQKP